LLQNANCGREISFNKFVSKGNSALFTDKISHLLQSFAYLLVCVLRSAVSHLVALGHLPSSPQQSTNLFNEQAEHEYTGKCTLFHFASFNRLSPCSLAPLPAIITGRSASSIKRTVAWFLFMRSVY